LSKSDGIKIKNPLAQFIFSRKGAKDRDDCNFDFVSLREKKIFISIESRDRFLFARKTREYLNFLFDYFHIE